MTNVYVNPALNPCVVTGGEFHEAWENLLEQITYRGALQNPRGKATQELLNVTLHVRQGLANVLVNPRRNINYRSMIAEWLWIHFGFFDVTSISQYIKKYREFTDDGTTLAGAYGPHFTANYGRIISQLQEDPSTRQAVMPIWRPGMMFPSKDVPCTISLQFLIRDKQLHTVVNMRSSDAWLGLPYDFFVFSQLANTVAIHVPAPHGIGSLTMHLGSSHLYEENLADAREAMMQQSYTIHSPKFTNLPEYTLRQAFKDQTSLFTEEDFSGHLWWRYYRILRQSDRRAACRMLKDLHVDYC